MVVRVPLSFAIRTAFVRAPASARQRPKLFGARPRTKETMTADVMIGWATILALVLIARGEYEPRRTYK